jgi:hypothetical protein
MNFKDVVLQQNTGSPVVPGSLSITPAHGSDVVIPPHDRVLLELPVWWNSDRGVAIWPVTGAGRDEHGFYDVTVVDYGIRLLSIGLEHLGSVARPDEARRSFSRGGIGTGHLMRRKFFSPTDRVPTAIDATPISNYELGGLLDTNGLNIDIAGCFASAGDANQPVKDLPDLAGARIAAKVAIPWHTLVLKNFPWAGSYWKYGHKGALSTLNSAERPRDPRKVSDLLIEQGLSRPIVRGRISFSPETAWNPKPAKFLHCGFSNRDSEGMYFSDAPDVVTLDNGFAGASGSYRFLTITALNRWRLEKELRWRDTLPMRLAGDAVGDVRYETGYGSEPSDPLQWISQRIETMLLRVSLGEHGLTISAEGDLHPFDAEEFARHKEQWNSVLQPVRHFSLEAMLPWALLIAREFPSWVLLRHNRALPG